MKLASWWLTGFQLGHVLTRPISLLHGCVAAMALTWLWWQSMGFIAVQMLSQTACCGAALVQTCAQAFD